MYSLTNPLATITVLVFFFAVIVYTYFSIPVIPDPLYILFLSFLQMMATEFVTHIVVNLPRIRVYVGRGIGISLDIIAKQL